MRLRRLALGAAGAVLLSAALPVDGATYSGEAAEPSVVWISGGPAPAPAPVEPVIRQNGKAFVPDVLVVPANASVRFSNDDPFYHSVYSTSPGNAFDLGLYDTGAGKSVTFEHPGIVEVRCHVHGSMHATIIVIDGPFARTTQPNERYRIEDAPRGEHQLHSWNAGSGESVRTVNVR